MNIDVKLYENEHKISTALEDLQVVHGKDSLDEVELPQEWCDINDAYEATGNGDHKLLGGLIYKDFEGNIKVYPLALAYGVRTDECGAKLPAVAVYNSAQQLLVKPATDGRHTVPLRQLDEFFGGGSTSDLGEKKFSLQKIPPVDTSLPIADREPYVFCRDSGNKFSGKKYSTLAKERTLVERDEYGRILVKAPTKDEHAVNLEYLNNGVVADVIELARRLNALADSDDKTLDQLSEIVAYIKSNKSLIDSITTSKVSTSGGTMTGTLAIQKSNPAVKLIDASNNTTAFVQMYQDRLRMGYTWRNSLAVDKDGNVEVYGGLKMGGTPKNDTDAVTVGYLNNSGFITADYVSFLENSVDMLLDVIADRLSSVGLVYSLTNDTYSVKAGAGLTDTIVIISKTHEGLPVTSIGNHAFSGCGNITDIVIPDSVTSIGASAFYECSNLRKITFPYGVKSIGNFAFYNCSSLTDFNIPDSVTSIGASAFHSCGNITDIVIPSGVTSISDYAFSWCRNLTEVTFNGTPNSIHSTAFEVCSNLKTINVPWAEGEVAGAPWSATKATINYNYKGA